MNNKGKHARVSHESSCVCVGRLSLSCTVELLGNCCMFVKSSVRKKQQVSDYMRHMQILLASTTIEVQRFLPFYRRYSCVIHFVIIFEKLTKTLQFLMPMKKSHGGDFRSVSIFFSLHRRRR